MVYKFESHPYRFFLINVAIFVIVLLNKVFTHFDLAILFLLFNSLFFLDSKINKRVIVLLAVFLSFFVYATMVSSIYGMVEIIWPMKFARTAIIFFLSYYFFINIRRYLTYEDFKWSIIYIVAFHSILIYCLIFSSEMRGFIYGITGYIPRGPAWSRSPGVTISFNATAIVHVVAIFFLVGSKCGAIKKIFFLCMIFPSLFFLGRTITYLAIGIMILNFSKKSPIILVFMSSLVFLLIKYMLGESYSDGSMMSYIVYNIHHAVEPILLTGTESGVDKYAFSVLSKHIYFSEDWKVLLFGNSLSGHMSMLDLSGGETNSDIGFVNSVNANGVIITLMMYVFYFYFVYLSRNGDWKSVFFISVLSIALTFKETGFFTSHVTPLLFLMVFYQLFGSSVYLSCRKRKGIESEGRTCNHWS